MFKRLRDRLEETRQPPRKIPQTDESELTNNTVVNHDDKLGSAVLNEENQFSITEDDGTSSEMGSPQKSAGGDDQSRIDFNSPTDQFLFAFTDTPQHRSYIPPSDLESEVEDPSQSPPTILDESVSKEQLYLALQRLHARVQKYKTKYSKVALACKEANSDKEKIMRTLSDNQDRALRRLNELKEQCNLEQQAKAHLEENLRVILEEKDQMISVLHTKVQLLKDGQSLEEDKEVEVSPENGNGKENTGNIQDCQRKVKRLEELLTRCKDALQSNKERSGQLTLERDQLANQLEQKELELQRVQEDEGALQARLRGELAASKDVLAQLRKEQEESAMTMAETKRSFHEELEVREQKLSETRNQLTSLKEELSALQKKCDNQTQNYKSLEEKLNTTTASLEKEKDELVAQLSRGKVAALDLLKETQQKQILNIESEWNLKYEKLQQDHEALIEEANKYKSNEKKSSSEELEMLRTECENLKCDLSTLRENENKFSMEISSLKENRGNLTEELRTLSKHKDELENCKTTLEENLEKLTAASAERLEKNTENELQASERIAGLNEQLNTLMKEKEEIENEKMSLFKEFNSLKQELDDIRVSKKEMENKEKIELEAERTSINEDKLLLEKEISFMKDALKSKNEELTAAQEVKLTYETEGNTLKMALQLSEENLSVMKDELESLTVQLNSFRESFYNAANDFNRNLSIEVGSLESLNNFQLSEVIFKLLKHERQKLQDEMDCLKNSLNEKDKNEQQLNETISVLDAKLREKDSASESKFNQLNIKLIETENKIKENDETVFKQEGHINNLNEQILCLQKAADQRQETLVKLEESLRREAKLLKEKSQIISNQEEELCNLKDSLLKSNVQLNAKEEICSSFESEIAEKILQLEKANEELESYKRRLESVEAELATTTQEKIEKEQLWLESEQQVCQQIKDLNAMIIAKSEENRGLEIRCHESESLMAELVNEKRRNENQSSLNLEKGNAEKDALIDKLKQISKNLEAEISDLKFKKEEVIESSQKLLTALTAKQEESELKIKQFSGELEILEKCIDVAVTEAMLNSVLPGEKIEISNDGDSFSQLQTKLSFHVKHLKNLNTECNQLLKQLSLLENDKLQLESSNASLESSFSVEREAHEKTVKQLEEKVIQSEEIPILKAQTFGLEKQVESLQSQNKEQENEISKLKDNSSKLKTKLKEQFRKCKSLEEKISILEEEILHMRTDLNNALEKNGEIEEARRILFEETGVLKSEKLQMKAELNDKICEISEWEGNCTALENKLSSADNTISMINSDLQSRCEELETDRANYSDLKKQIESLEHEKCLLESRLTENNATHSSLEVLNMELDSKSNRVITLEKECEILKDQITRSFGEDFVETLKSQLSTAQEKMKELELQICELQSRHNCEITKLSEMHCAENESSSLELVKLREELKVRDSQLDESLIVAEANTSDVVHNLEVTKSELVQVSQENENLKSKLSEAEGLSVTLKNELEKEKKQYEEEKKQYEEEKKANEEAVDGKLKQLVRDFSLQMQTKEQELDKSLSETIERYHDLEQKLNWDKEKTFTSLEKELTEQSAAMEEMREHFLAEIKEKDDLLAKLKLQIGKKPASDWDNAWEEEPDLEPQALKSSKLEELQSSVNNYQNVINFSNNSSDNHLNKDGSILEPTEFEYLRNILMEYMMGKEPLILAKVIAAVLRFPEEQTNEILQREEARAATTQHW